MKLVVLYLNFLLVSFYLTRADISGELYVPLIKWIRNYYSTSSIFFLSSFKEDKHFDNFKIKHLSYLWSRMLQREQIATLTTSFKNIHTLKNNHLRSLVIVIIPGSYILFEFSKISKSLKMSSFSWFVIFISYMKDIKKYCYEPPGNIFNLLYDTQMLVMCGDDPVLREWYSIDENKTEIFDIVKWYPEKQQIGFPAAVDLLTNLSLYERRNNLKGKVLRAVIVKDSLLFSIKNNKMTGYFSLAITELENALNFTLNIVAEKREFGSYNMTTKRWSGAFSLVASGEVDIGISDFSMTNTRLNFVDYTIPIITTKRCLFLKQPEMFTVKWFAYYKVYNFMLWISLIVTMIISLLVLAFIRSRIESNNMIREIFHEFIRVWGIFCQQGISGELPRNLSLKLAYFTVLVTALVIFTAYSASMISFVTACIRNVPFHSIEEFIDDSSYSLIMLKGSADYDMFIYSKDSTSKYMMSKRLPIDKLPIDVESGFQIICENSKIGYYNGYSKKIQKITPNWRIPCEVYCIDIGPIDSLSLILSKNNQFTSLINYYLQKLLNSGILNRFKNEDTFAEENKFEPVAIYSVASIVIIFCCGALLALVILVIEIYYKKLNSKYLERNISKD